MSYKIQTLSKFDKNLKALIKKYPSLKNEFIEFVKKLKDHPTQGIQIAPNCYKIRISISSKGKGKCSGARLITNIIISEQTVYLLTIYNKSEKSSISDKELKELLKEI